MSSKDQQSLTLSHATVAHALNASDWFSFTVIMHIIQELAINRYYLSPLIRQLALKLGTFQFILSPPRLYLFIVTDNLQVKCTKFRYTSHVFQVFPYLRNRSFAIFLNWGLLRFRCSRLIKLLKWESLFEVVLRPIFRKLFLYIWNLLCLLVQIIWSSMVTVSWHGSGSLKLSLSYKVSASW